MAISSSPPRPRRRGWLPLRSGTPRVICASRCRAPNASDCTCRPCVTETPRIACRSTFAAPAPESRRAIAPGPSRHWLRPPPSPPISNVRAMWCPCRRKPTVCWVGGDPPRRPSTWPAWRNGGRPPRSARSSRPIIPSRWRTTPSRSNSPSNTDWPWSRSGSWWRIAGGSSPRWSGLRQRRCPPGPAPRSGGCPATRRRGLPCAVRGHRW